MSNPFAITVQKKMGDTQFVGVHLPKHLADALAVYAIYRGVSKQTVIQEVVAGLFVKELPINRIIERLSDRAVSHWRTMLRENTGKIGWQNDADENRRLDKFQGELKKTLLTRGVSKPQINEILAPLKREYAKDKEEYRTD